VYLGHGNLLLVGDAAGLIDAYRGMGMDAAALSAIYAVKSIVNSEKGGHSPIDAYARSMGKIVRQIERNRERQASRFASDLELERSLSGGSMLIGGLGILLGNLLNRYLPPDRIRLIPP
jgi:flavin-dependent dehydrogenase